MTGFLSKQTVHATKGIPGLGKVTKELQRTEKKVVKETKRPFKKPKIKPISDPDASPEPVLMQGVEAVKKKKEKKKGRRANILAGRMMAVRRSILNTQFNTKLGE